jgi:hypothetical protein
LSKAVLEKRLIGEEQQRERERERRKDRGRVGTKYKKKEE